jgi:hypothetical protein
MVPKPRFQLPVFPKSTSHHACRAAEREGTMTLIREAAPIREADVMRDLGDRQLGLCYLTCR